MGAKKGNKNALGNKGGKPSLFDSPDIMAEQIQLYFNGGANKRTVIIGKGDNRHEVEIPLYTISGLCYFLGFESRQSFYTYEKKLEFSYIIKKARLRIEMQYEESLQLEGTPTGSIFALKNMGWHDKTETDITTNGKDLIPTKTKIVFE